MVDLDFLVLADFVGTLVEVLSSSLDLATREGEEASSELSESTISSRSAVAFRFAARIRARTGGSTVAGVWWLDDFAIDPHLIFTSLFCLGFFSLNFGFWLDVVTPCEFNNFQWATHFYSF